MITTMTVWHGPVPGLYTQAARAHLTELPVTDIDCATSSPNSIDDHFPEDSILADEHNGLRLSNLDAWKADDVNRVIKRLKNHPLNFDVVITQDSAPIKSVKDAATTIHDFQIPKKAADYARQIEDFLLAHGSGLDTGVAAKLVDACSPDPVVAQRVAVTILAHHRGTTINWDTANTILNDLVRDIRPIWELGKAIATGDCAHALTTLNHVDTKSPVGILVYLENRYRLMLLASAGTTTKDIQTVFEKSNDWTIKNTMREAKGATPRMCAQALGDISATLSTMVCEGSKADPRIALEHCVVKLTARHRAARRK